MYFLILKRNQKSNIFLNINYKVYFFLGVGDFYCSGNDLGNFMNIFLDGIKVMVEKGGEILE